MEQSERDRPKEALRCWNDLQSYMDLIRKISRAEQRIDNFRVTMYDPKTTSYSDMPKASGDGTSRQERMVMRLNSMQESLKELASKENVLYKRIDDAIMEMRAERGALLSFRYLDGMKWSEVSLELFGEDPDYEDHEDRYVKRTFREHKEALLELEEIYDRIYPIGNDQEGSLPE